MKKHYTDYSTAAHWCGVNLVLCNNVPEIDPEIWDNIRGNFDPDREVFQYFITPATDDEVSWLVKTFDLIYAYSEKLDCWILLVDHWGTSWDYVPCEVFSGEWWEIQGEKYGYKHD